MCLTKLYNISKKENVAIYSYDLKTAPSMSIQDDDGYCYIAIDSKPYIRPTIKSQWSE